MDSMKYYGVLFNRKSGKIKLTLESIFNVILQGYPLSKGLKSTEDYVVFDSTNGEIKFYCEGTKNNNLPTICKDMNGKNIDDLCPELRSALNNS